MHEGVALAAAKLAGVERIKLLDEPASQRLRFLADRVNRRRIALNLQDSKGSPFGADSSLRLEHLGKALRP
jgi:hypothetical protein